MDWNIDRAAPCNDPGLRCPRFAARAVHAARRCASLVAGINPPPHASCACPSQACAGEPTHHSNPNRPGAAPSRGAHNAASTRQRNQVWCAGRPPPAIYRRAIYQNASPHGLAPVPPHTRKHHNSRTQHAQRCPTANHLGYDSRFATPTSAGAASSAFASDTCPSSLFLAASCIACSVISSTLSRPLMSRARGPPPFLPPTTGLGVRSPRSFTIRQQTSAFANSLFVG